MRQKNHLEGQSSPYLLQHADNPVDWHPWGEEALTKAQNENKPLLVSIGYSACHWCHVMERESFEDDEVAEIMNKYFVCIKVDREERPDIDHLYINAAQMLSGQAGWPLNCFAMPDGRPFWGGTYFPKEQWKNILARVAGLYYEQYEDVAKQADNLTRGLSEAVFIPFDKNQSSNFQRDEIQKIYANLMAEMDPAEGGMKGAPKFPLPVHQAFLLHYHNQTGDPDALSQSGLTLDKMAMGGIYDQLGGGFARYATDAAWRVPHFEKMLYDNAQLVSLYANAWKVVEKELYRDVVAETVAFLDREMRSPDGLYYAALDADSEGEEGKYYVWTGEEIDNVLGDDAPLVKKYYQVGEKGFWENGKNILMRDGSDEEFARKEGLDTKELKQIINRAKQKLLATRYQRVRPGLDDKVLVSWNAMMIQGLADAYAAFQEVHYLEKARIAADFLLTHAISNEGGLYHTLDGTKGTTPGFLEDYAMLSKALIRLYEVSMHLPYLEMAKTLTAYVMNNFSEDGTNLFSFSSGRSEQLAAPYYEYYDNVIPSSNSEMAKVLFYLANYFEKPEWEKRSQEMAADIKEKMIRYSSGFTNWGALLLHFTHPFHTLVVTGSDAPGKMMLLHRHFLPGTLIAAKTEGGENDPPVFEKRFENDKTLIHVCAQGYCKRPVSSVTEAVEQLR
ncbi:MAG: thioredoxin domain-containing protein [Bacteroidota bacterium]